MVEAARHPQAGRMLRVWFTQNGYPVLAVHRLDGLVRVTQRRVLDEPPVFDQPPMPFIFRVRYHDSNGASEDRLSYGMR